jgi:hypothetical protein
MTSRSKSSSSSSPKPQLSFTERTLKDLGLKFQAPTAHQLKRSPKLLPSDVETMVTVLKNLQQDHKSEEAELKATAQRIKTLELRVTKQEVQLEGKASEKGLVKVAGSYRPPVGIRDAKHTYTALPKPRVNNDGLFEEVDERPARQKQVLMQLEVHVLGAKDFLMMEIKRLRKEASEMEEAQRDDVSAMADIKYEVQTEVDELAQSIKEQKEAYFTTRDNFRVQQHDFEARLQESFDRLTRELESIKMDIEDYEAEAIKTLVKIEVLHTRMAALRDNQRGE